MLIMTKAMSIGAARTMPEHPIPVSYKFLVGGFFYVFLALIVARITFSFVWPDPTPAQSATVDDLWIVAKMILAALLGILAGKSAK